jgi:hypothetical protein
MGLHDALFLLVLGAVVVYGLGRMLIASYFAAKRRNQQLLMHELSKGEEVS